MNNKKKLRVLIVDDSAVVRNVLSDIISSDPALEVMGTAADPFIAAERIKQEVPDVITLDVEMPRMDGVTFLRRLMSQHPVPVVVCSSLVSAKSETLQNVLASGATDVICKPEMGLKGFLEESCIQICDAIKAAAQAKLKNATPMRAVAPKQSADAVLAPPSGGAMTKTTEKIVAVGASTGGIEALRVFLEGFPLDCPPILIVQHMPAAFTAALAKRLDGICGITVREARHGDRMLRGQALIAPGDKHGLLTRSGAVYKVELRDGPLVSRHKPSVDVLFRSVARVAGKNAVGIIMTGMGDDGARGMKEMRDVGARTLGQDEASCVVYGMPQAAMKIGAVEDEIPLSRMTSSVLRLC